MAMFASKGAHNYKIFNPEYGFRFMKISHVSSWAPWKHAEENGAGAVHGITSAFFGDVNPTFRGLYEAFLMYNWDEDLHENLMDPFRNAVQRRGSGTYCATKYKLLADPLEESIKSANL